MYSDNEIINLGFIPYKIGEPVDGLILQADHSEYRSLTKEDFLGVKAIVDGRRILSAENFVGISFMAIGSPAI
jgi:UDP-N-acetyl-D-mannosaminuronate dehydrogenase